MVLRQQSRSAVLLGAVVALALTLNLTGTATAASRVWPRPPTLGSPLAVGMPHTTARNPGRNLAPQPNYTQSCAADGPNNKTCISTALAAIENARAHEGVRRAVMVLPANYRRLSIAEQTFVVTDLERVARGLKPFRGLTTSLDDASSAAAALRIDPAPAFSLLRLLGVTEYGAVWASDFGPLASDYDWMYNDGYSSGGSINIDCPNPQASGCWGHRDIILGLYRGLSTLIAGAGTAHPAGASIAELLTGSNSRAPKLSYTWRQAVRHGATNIPASSGH